MINNQNFSDNTWFNPLRYLTGAGVGSDTDCNEKNKFKDSDKSNVTTRFSIKKFIIYDLFTSIFLIFSNNRIPEFFFF